MVHRARSPSTTNRGLEIAHFACDVEAIIDALDKGEKIPETADVQRSIRVLYHAAAEPLRLNEPTEWLIELLRDGSYTIAQIQQAVRERYGMSAGDAIDDLVVQCMDALETLFWEGVVSLD